MNNLQDALKKALPSAEAAPLAAREAPPPSGVALLPSPADHDWAQQLARHGVRVDRASPVANWVQKTAALVRELEAKGQKGAARDLVRSRDEFTKLREKKAWEGVKARFEALELPEKTYRALKQEGADVEKLLARLHTRKAEEFVGMGAARLRELLLGR